jgi:hypothetical protein
MKLNTVFLAAAILGVVFGLFALVAPAPFITLQGLTPSLGLGIALRGIGAAYLGYAALNWLARGWTDRTARRGAAIANLIGFGLTAVVTLYGIFSAVGAPGPGWLNFVLELLIALGFAYVIYLKPAEI